MKRVPIVPAILWAVAATSIVRAAPPQLPAAKFVFETVPVCTLRDAIPVFLSGDSLSVLLDCRGPGKKTVALVMLKLRDGNIRQTANTSLPEGAKDIFSTSEQRALVVYRNTLILYSLDLSSQSPVPMHKRLLSKLFPRSGYIGEWDRDWVTVRLAHEIQVTRGGTGQLLSVSDEAILFRQSDAVKILSQEGRSLGSIPVPANTKGTPVAELAGSNRLLMERGPMTRILDFSGRRIADIPRPPGWGFRHGWSADGARVLFDHYTRNESFLENAFDSVASVVVPVPEQSNGEIVTVVDTSNGQECLHLSAPAGGFGSEGRMHSDISPDGRLVAVADRTELRIYELIASRCGK